MSVERTVFENFDTKDFDLLLNLDKEAFPEDFWPEELYRSEFAKYPSVVKVVKAEGRIIGYFYDALYEGELCDGTNGPFGEVASIAVNADYRRSGLGSIILSEAIAELKRMKAPRIILHTRTDNFPMQGLAKKLGFEVIGVYPDYYSDSDALELELKDKI